MSIRPYEIVFMPSIRKDVRRLPRSVLDTILDRIETLSDDPVPTNAEPMRGYDHTYRIRIGRYRVVYAVEKVIRVITVMRIGHRKDVYRHL